LERTRRSKDDECLDAIQLIVVVLIMLSVAN